MDLNVKSQNTYLHLTPKTCTIWWDSNQFKQTCFTQSCLLKILPKIKPHTTKSSSRGKHSWLHLAPEDILGISRRYSFCIQILSPKGLSLVFEAHHNRCPLKKMSWSAKQEASSYHEPKGADWGWGFVSRTQFKDPHWLLASFKGWKLRTNKIISHKPGEKFLNSWEEICKWPPLDHGSSNWSRDCEYFRRPLRKGSCMPSYSKFENWLTIFALPEIRNCFEMVSQYSMLLPPQSSFPCHW